MAAKDTKRKTQKGSVLALKSCVPCRGETDPLQGDDLKKFDGEISDEWELVDEHHLHRDWKFDDFAGAQRFVNEVGAIAEKENHHPEIFFTYGKVSIDLHTHKIDGLSPNDFILAAKIDQLDAGNE
ncbi:MAG: 4a-hydroxytetrahydrobiopterin dehydratase [Phycisphaerae bacterium]